MPNQVLIESGSREASANSRVLLLIEEYLRLEKQAVAALRQLCNGQEPLRAWRSGELSKSGKLPLPDSTYDFHGAGCSFQIGKLVVDVDFSSDKAGGAFDAWKLSRLAESRGDSDLDLIKIERSLNCLEKEGKIQIVQGGVSEHIYRIRVDAH